MDERDDSAIIDSLGEYLHHFRVVDRIKELLEVHIHDPSVSLVSRVQHVIDRVVRFLVRPETVASVRGHYLLTHFWTDKVTLTVESGAFS